MNNFELPFRKENIRIILIGLVVNIIGYLLMIGGGSEDPNKFDAKELFSHTRITIAPLLIVTGFVIILWGIMKKSKK
jgi:Protein of unknown function (DUF3098)